MENKQVVIIGAGPVGLAMAVRLKRAKIPFQILERGQTVGANMLEWGQVELFTTWKESVDPISVALLKAHNLEVPLSDENPKSADFVRHYLSKVASVIPDTDIRYGAEVDLVHYDPDKHEFIIQYTNGGREVRVQSAYVFDASGTWQNPNQVVHNQRELKQFIRTGIPDSNAVNELKQGSQVVVAGGGHSAMNSILELSQRKDLKIVWIVRAKEPRFGKSKVGGRSRQLEDRIKQLIDRGIIELKCEFEVGAIQVKEATLNVTSVQGDRISGVGELISNIGAFSDFDLLSNIDLHLDDKNFAPFHLADKINPSLHSCDTVSYHFNDTLVTDKPYFLIGSKTFGKASNFLLSKGYQILDEIMSQLFHPKG